MKSPQVREDLALLFAVVLLAVAYAAALLWIARGLGRLAPDSMEYAEIARSLLRGTGYRINLIDFHVGLRHGGIRHVPELHGLLQPFLILPFFGAFGPDGVLVKWPTVLLTALTIPVIFVGSRALFGRLAAVIAVGLFVSRVEVSFLALTGCDDVGYGLFTTCALLLLPRAAHSSTERRLLACGLMAGLATLEKFTGVLFPIVVALTAASNREARRAWRWKEGALLTVPTLLAAAAYVGRNYAAHGSPGFQFSAIDWLSKPWPYDYFAYYDVRPTFGTVWSRLGGRGVLEVIFHQVSLLFEIAWRSPLLYLGGPVALLMTPADRSFLVPVRLYVLAMLTVVSVVYHVEERYLSALVPLFCIALGAKTSELTQRWSFLRESALGSPWTARGLLMAAALAAGVAILRVHSLGIRSWHAPCAKTVAYLQRTAGPSAAILTSNPWFVSWIVDRSAVNAPTSGTASLVAVARHYRTRWALVGLGTIASADLGAALASKGAAGLRPTRIFHDGECAVYRLQVPR